MGLLSCLSRSAPAAAFLFEFQSSHEIHDTGRPILRLCRIGTAQLVAWSWSVLEPSAWRLASQTATVFVSCSTRRGALTSSRVPVPGLERISSVPPTASRRSTMLIRPSPLPHAALTSNPTPSSTIVSARPSELPLKCTDTVCPAALDGVLQRFLNDSEQTQRQVGRERRRNGIVREGDGEVGS